MSVCRFMYPFHRPSAGVVHVLEGGIPSESFGGGQATLGTLGTLRAALSLGKCSSKMVR